MYPRCWPGEEELVRDRNARSLAEAHERRLARLALGDGPLWRRLQIRLRARAARKLFEGALAADREETWRVVWERLEARGRL
jgi:hypothetical protein